jgi:hypothetical protein
MKQSAKDPSVVVLDGVLVQAATTSTAEMGLPSLRGTDLLQQHMLWESQYVAHAKNWPALRPGGAPIDIGLGDIKTMMWAYDAPELFDVQGVQMSRMMYVTAAIDDFVLTLGAPLQSGDDAARTAGVLVRGMRTLRREATPIDVFAVSAAAQANQPMPETCSRVGPP